MITIHEKLVDPPAHARRVEVVADRHTLAKTRWRGTAADGTDFGFDLHEPLRHDDAFHEQDGVLYVIRQTPEAVIEVCGISGKTEAAQIGWAIGNMHHAIEVLPDCIRVVDDPVLRQLFAKMGLDVKHHESIFQPAKLGPTHAH